MPQFDAMFNALSVKMLFKLVGNELYACKNNLDESTRGNTFYSEKLTELL